MRKLMPAWPVSRAISTRAPSDAVALHPVSSSKSSRTVCAETTQVRTRRSVTTATHCLRPTLTTPHLPAAFILSRRTRPVGVTPVSRIIHKSRQIAITK